MKLIIAIAALFSSSVFANSMLTIDTSLVDGTAVIQATNVSGVDLECKYTVNWRTSWLDLHKSWGTVKIENTKTAWIVIEDSRGLPVTKATPHFDCNEL